MSTSHRHDGISSPPLAAILVALALQATAGLPLPAQVASPLEINRIFLTDTTMLHAVELNGTIAWSQLLFGLPGSTAGTTVDGLGHIWLVDPYASTVLRFRADGTPDLVAPVPGPPGTMIRMPAVDREGNCYVCQYVPDPLAPFGYQGHVVKLDPLGAILWDRDLTPELASSQPPEGLLDQVRVDEDGYVWVVFSNPPTALGGRILRLDPQGNTVLSFEAGGSGIQINTDRTVRVVRGWEAVPPGGAVVQPPRVRTYSFDGVLLQEVALAGASAGNAFLTHPSNRFLLVAANTVYGPFFPSGSSSAGYPALFQGGLGNWISPPPLLNVRDAAIAPDGAIWALALPVGAPLSSYAVRYGAFLANGPGSGFYPVAGQTFLGTAPFPTSTSATGDNSGSRFTAYDWCLIVDPWGDLDGDHVLNRNEIVAGTNPCDPQSVQGTLQVAGLSIGSTAMLGITAASDGGLPYATVASLGDEVLGLSDHRGFRPGLADPLAAWWLMPANPLVTGALGTLDASGQASVSVALPNDPALDGILIHFGFATFDASWSAGTRTLYGPLSMPIGGPAGP